MLETVPGVRVQDVDFEAQRAELLIDPERVDEKALQSALEAGGYRGWDIASETRTTRPQVTR